MFTTLAQIEHVSPGFLHQALLLFLGLLTGGASAAAIIGVFLKKKRTLEPQPLDVREDELARRLAGHDQQIDALWNTLRDENTAIRREMTQMFQDIERALGRIEGSLTSSPRDHSARP